MYVLKSTSSLGLYYKGLIHKHKIAQVTGYPDEALRFKTRAEADLERDLYPEWLGGFEILQISSTSEDGATGPEEIRKRYR